MAGGGAGCVRHRNGAYGGECSPNAWRGDFTAERLAPARPGSLEDVLRRQGWREAFVDLRAAAGDEPFVMSGLEHGQEHRTDWRRVFDGVWFVERMEPVEVG